MDRGYAKFALFNRIVVAKSSYVCRIRDYSVFEMLEDRPLSPAAVAERLTGDFVISLGSDSNSERAGERRRITRCI